MPELIAGLVYQIKGIDSENCRLVELFGTTGGYKLPEQGAG
jgi:hypothetical protein